MDDKTREAWNRIWRYLQPIRERKMSEVSLNNLRKEKPKWNNLPTKAIRIPEIFADQLVAIARMLDNEDVPNVEIELDSKDMNEAINILKKTLTMKANNGSAIKRENRKVIAILEKQAAKKK